MKPERLMLCNFQSPGDIVMLTAAVRDLHRSYPGRYLTGVRTSCPELWLHNPHIRSMEDEVGARRVHCQYPLIHESNQRPVHFVEGFIHHLNEALGLEIRLSEKRGDLYLSEQEQRESPVGGSGGAPVWLIVGGGKYDFTIKWWHFRRWQAVVDHFRGRIQFVQVGEADHYHPPLHGVKDLRGRTSLRDLVRLVYFAEGVLCPVTLAMHLAAAVPRRQGRARHCVVVAGGREPPSWERYPGHYFLHTVGDLACCATGGCWRSRTVALGDGDEKDGELCVDVVGGLPHCMHRISVADVCECVEACLAGVEARDEGVGRKEWR